MPRREKPLPSQTSGTRRLGEQPAPPGLAHFTGLDTEAPGRWMVARVLQPLSSCPESVGLWPGQGVVSQELRARPGCARRVPNVGTWGGELPSVTDGAPEGAMATAAPSLPNCRGQPSP